MREFFREPVHPFDVGDRDAAAARARAEVAAEREWLRAHAGLYEAAVAKWQDLEWCHDALAACREVALALAEYDPSAEPSRKAVFLVGRAQQSLDSVFAQVEVIEVYAARAAAFEALAAQLEAERSTD